MAEAADAVVLAAGASARFGAPKQLALIDGVPMLERVVRALDQASGVRRLLVVLGAYADDIRRTVDLGRAEVLFCADWRAGMSATLRCGLDALTPARWTMVAVADQPGLTPQAVDCLLAVADVTDAPALRATYAGRPGHPVLLGPDLVLAARSMAAGEGARHLLARTETASAELSSLCDGRDVDTRADLARMSAA